MPRTNSKAQPAIRVLIADAQRLFSGALGTALSRKYQYEVITDRPKDTEHALKAVDKHRPDVILLDYWLDQGTATERILECAPNCKVIVMSGIYAPGQVQETVAAGAAGFLPKSVSVDVVADAVRRAHGGESLVYADELQAMVKRMDERHREAEEFTKRIDTLSNREMQVLVLLGKGRLIQDIAKELGISQPTVTGHINRMLKKTHARYQTRDCPSSLIYKFPDASELMPVG